MTDTELRAVVGVGANLGDRHATLQRAVDALGRVARLRAASPVYETSPVGPPQPEFLNAAILVETRLAPETFLDELLAIEASLGRVRSVRWGPRTIDLDVLWIEGLVVATERLVVPHLHLHERAFALRPLLDVAPDAVDPRTGMRFVALEEETALRRTALALRVEPAPPMRRSG